MSNIIANNERAVDTIVKVIDFEEMADNTGSSAQITIGKIPAGGAVLNAGVYEKVALAGASDITLDVGTTSGDPDELIDALDVDAMSAPVYNTGDLFEASNAGGIDLVGLTNTDTDILVEWNGTVANLTAGKVVVAVTVVNLGKFA